MTQTHVSIENCISNLISFYQGQLHGEVQLPNPTDRVVEIKSEWGGAHRTDQQADH